MAEEEVEEWQVLEMMMVVAVAEESVFLLLLLPLLVKEAEVEAQEYWKFRFSLHL